jgi:hypothetical protein
MKINAQIYSILESCNINTDDGLAYLIGVYYGLRPSYIPIELLRRMNLTGILGISPDKEIQWNFPLFETVAQEKWDWVKEWNNEFGQKNKARQGSSTAVISRMKAFFADNPDVRKEDVIGATQMYFSTVSSPEYLTSSHYFIYKGVGKDRVSALELWVDRYRESIKNIPQEGNNDLSSLMQ